MRTDKTIKQPCWLVGRDKLTLTVTVAPALTRLQPWAGGWLLRRLSLPRSDTGICGARKPLLCPPLIPSPDQGRRANQLVTLHQPRHLQHGAVGKCWDDAQNGMFWDPGKLEMNTFSCPYQTLTEPGLPFLLAPGNRPVWPADRCLAASQVREHRHTNTLSGAGRLGDTSRAQTSAPLTSTSFSRTLCAAFLSLERKHLGDVGKRRCPYLSHQRDNNRHTGVCS